MPIKLLAQLDKDGKRVILGQVLPDHYVNIRDYSSGTPRNISVRIDNGSSEASVYEFTDGAYSSIRHPHKRYLPLQSYTKRNLDAVLHPGESFSHDLETKTHAKGSLTLTYLPPKRRRFVHHF